MVELTLTHQAIAEMTGRTLMSLIGLLDKDGTWYNGNHVSFRLNGTEWTAYTTSGRGRLSGKTYLHIYRYVVCKVIDPDGKDTGGRVTDRDDMHGDINKQIQEW